MVNVESAVKSLLEFLNPNTKKITFGTPTKAQLHARYGDCSQSYPVRYNRGLDELEVRGKSFFISASSPNIEIITHGLTGMIDCNWGKPEWSIDEDDSNSTKSTPLDYHKAALVFISVCKVMGLPLPKENEALISAMKWHLENNPVPYMVARAGVFE